jgi:ABC-type transporter Mla maintaining outer membrane lipid asymmetry ATPase subunit MlaF
MSTIERVDRIQVVSEGQVVWTGTYRERLAQDGVCVLQFLHSGRHGQVHDSELRAPLVERRRVNPRLPAW